MDEDQSSISSVDTAESLSSESYEEEIVTDEDVREVVLVQRRRLDHEPLTKEKDSAKTVSFGHGTAISLHDFHIV